MTGDNCCVQPPAGHVYVCIARDGGVIADALETVIIHHRVVIRGKRLAGPFRPYSPRNPEPFASSSNSQSRTFTRASPFAWPGRAGI
jgi:hypothetical protein